QFLQYRIRRIRAPEYGSAGVFSSHVTNSDVGAGRLPARAAHLESDRYDRERGGNFGGVAENQCGCLVCRILDDSILWFARHITSFVSCRGPPGFAWPPAIQRDIPKAYVFRRSERSGALGGSDKGAWKRKRFGTIHSVGHDA